MAHGTANARANAGVGLAGGILPALCPSLSVSNTLWPVCALFQTVGVWAAVVL